MGGGKEGRYRKWERHGGRSLQRDGTENGNGTGAVPYKMSRDTRPRVSAGSGRTVRTPREGCPYDVNMGMHHFAGIQKSFWCAQGNGAQAVPYITLSEKAARMGGFSCSLE